MKVFHILNHNGLTSTGNIPYYSIQSFYIFLTVSLCNVILLHGFPPLSLFKHPWVSSLQSPMQSTLLLCMEEKSFLQRTIIEHPRNLTYSYTMPIAFLSPHPLISPLPLPKQYPWFLSPPHIISTSAHPFPWSTYLVSVCYSRILCRCEPMFRSLGILESFYDIV